MLAPNTLVQDRYRISRCIGQGGMGTVYLASDQRFGSNVALKETSYVEVQLRRAFEREAGLLHHLRHPALPRVTDYFVEGTNQYLVMEYVPGEDLSERLSSVDHFHLTEVLEWADQLLDALEYLHSQNPPVIHRDIKPHNMKVNREGKVILLDFGIAKGRLGGPSSTATNKSLVGFTLTYAPFEQVRGSGTDQRSDLYAIAATLYHLLTGVPPCDAMARTDAVLRGSPDPLVPAHRINSEITSQLSDLLHSALAQNPEDRPQSATAMRRVVRECMSNSGVRGNESFTSDVGPTLLSPTITSPAPPDPTLKAIQLHGPRVRERVSGSARKKNIWAWVVGATLFSILLLLGVLIYARHLKSGSDNAGTLTSEVLNTRTPGTLINQFDGLQGPVVFSFSPDGKSIAAGGNDGNLLLWDTDKNVLAGKIAFAFKSSVIMESIAFSPTGKALSVVAYRETRDTDPWSPESLLRAEESPLRAEELRLRALNAADRYVFVWDLRSPEPTRTIIGLGGGKAMFSPDGRILACAGRGIRRWDTDTWDELPPFKLRDEEVFSVGFTRDGKAILGLASDKNGSRKVYVWNSKSGTVEQTIAGSAKHASEIAVSPDNETLAGFTYDGRILLWEFRTGYIRKIFGDYKANEVSALEFSPDGKFLAVSSTHKNQATITLWDVRDGTSKLAIPNDHPLGIVRFSPDGSTLAGAGWDEKVKLWSVRGLER